MTVSEFYKKLDELYPKTLSCEWDNDGLMCAPDPFREVRRVLVSLDATSSAIGYAADNGFDLLLTHHPMIFSGVKCVVPDTFPGKRIIGAIENGVAVISLHTRLDAAPGGVSETLAGLFGEVCGTFGDDDMKYAGRIVRLPVPVSLVEFGKSAKEKLGAPAVRITGTRPVSIIAAVGGSGKGLISAARSAGADTIITGEVPYNDAEDSAECGINIVEAGHYFTEAPICRKLASLAKNIAGAESEIYGSDPQIVL